MKIQNFKIKQTSLKAQDQLFDKYVKIRVKFYEQSPSLTKRTLEVKKFCKEGTNKI